METVNVDKEEMHLGSDGMIHFSVTTEMGTAKVMALPFSDADKLAELWVMRGDLERALVAHQRMLSLDPGKTAGIRTDRSDNEALLTVLFEGAVMMYARCFDANGKHGHNLKIDDVLRKDQTTGRGFHDFIYGLRQRHVAHDLNTFRNAGAGVAFFGKEWVLSEPSISSAPDAATLQNFGVLLRDALAYVMAEIGRLRGLVLLQIAGMTPEERGQLVPLTLPAPDVSNVGKVRRNRH